LAQDIRGLGVPAGVLLGVGMAATLELGGEFVGDAGDQRSEGVVVIVGIDVRGDIRVAIGSRI
jgi:hypothetical protein